mmetsp:Transcript_37255/g.113885  ORF Transcript_37255/g.113885 Transcript_37255/m.113885 type:complete len:314 (+) Transcript_37255:457-1398(+)
MGPQVHDEAHTLVDDGHVLPARVGRRVRGARSGGGRVRVGRRVRAEGAARDASKNTALLTRRRRLLARRVSRARLGLGARRFASLGRGRAGPRRHAGPEVPAPVERGGRAPGPRQVERVPIRLGRHGADGAARRADGAVLVDVPRARPLARGCYRLPSRPGPRDADPRDGALLALRRRVGPGRQAARLGRVGRVGLRLGRDARGLPPGRSKSAEPSQGAERVQRTDAARVARLGRATQTSVRAELQRHLELLRPLRLDRRGSVGPRVVLRGAAEELRVFHGRAPAPLPLVALRGPPLAGDAVVRRAGPRVLYR